MPRTFGLFGARARAYVVWLTVLLAGVACGYDDGRSDGERTDAGRPGPALDAPGGPGGGSGLPACSNGIDDDCDGLIDFAGGDPGCSSAADTDERGPGLVCDDGIDNDGDGRIDHVVAGCGTTLGDPGCSSPTDVSELDVPGPP